MAFFGKEYTLASQTNFEPFLKSIGLSEEQIAKVNSIKSTSKITKNGDSYTSYSIGVEGPKETTFKSGVEFDDSIKDTPIKTKYTIDGNTVTQEITSDKGSVTFKRVYNDDELVVTMTSSLFDGVATRTYKA